MSTEVSVIIPAKNVAGFLGGQLQALTHQIEAPGFEVIIADNNSTDDLLSVVRDFEDRLNIRVIDASKYPGASYARNRGAAAAEGIVYLFCDADDVVCPVWVAEMTQAVLSTRDCVVAGRLRHDGLNDKDQIYAYDVDAARGDLQYSRDDMQVASEPFAGYLPSAPGASLGFRGKITIIWEAWIAHIQGGRRRPI